MNIVMAMNMGGDDFIAKPFDLNVLTAKLQAVLRRSYDFAAPLPALEFRGARLSATDAVLELSLIHISLSILGRSILQAHADRIPPGMDDFVGKVEVILVFLRFVVIQLHIEADRIVHGLIAGGIAAGRNRIFPGRIAGRGGRGVGRRCSGAGIAASSAVGTVGTAGGQSEHHGQRKQNGQ